MSNPFDTFTPEPWTAEAVCASHPMPDLWFAGDGNLSGNNNHHSTRLAISLCNSCPVQSECLEYATNNNETFGIWAGLTANQRNKIAARAAA